MKTSIVSVLVLLSTVASSVFHVDYDTSQHELKPTAYDLKYDSSTLSEPYIPTDNGLTEEGVRLGRLLFYDPILSSNNEMSCGTCHIQNLGFTDGRKLAIGTYGDTLNRNTMSLVNLAWSNSFFWDGRVSTLEGLVREPIINPLEMAQDTIELVLELKSHKHYPELFSRAFPNEEISMENVSKAVAQFLRTIVSNGIDANYGLFPGLKRNEIGRLVEEQDIRNEQSLRGSFVRFSDMCNPCHGGGVYGNQIIADNALTGGEGENFKAVSLLNVKLTAPYMHDGRFKSLREVVEHYDDNYDTIVKINASIEFKYPNLLTDYDMEQIEQVFELFSDSSIINNPDFSNPFNSGFSWSERID